ncbi:hypothetical protein OC844_004947 [Tilletia horrida]|nr:hypothetical protein OC844_004947 [Tilletia horrida]
MRCRLSQLACFGSALVSFASIGAAAVDFRVQLVPNQYLADVAFLTSYSPAFLRRIPDATLDAQNATVPKVMHTLARRDGSIHFTNVAPGPWLLEIQAPYLVFNQYRVDIPEPSAVTPPAASAEGAQGLTWKGQPAVRVHLRGQSLASTLLAPVLPYPLIAAPISKQMFYTEPEKFNIKALLANPMILMGAVGMLLIFVVPKLQSQMDPEAQAEMRASQAAMQKKMAAFQSGDLGALFREDPPPRASGSQAGGGSNAAVRRR